MIAPPPITFQRPPQRILIIKPSAIGDVTHTLPILALLRNHWPDAHIAWLVAPACAGLLEGHPMLNQIILFQRKRFGSAWKNPAAASEFLRFSKSLRRERFDLVLDFQGLFRSGYLARITGAPVRVGFANARELAPLFYTRRVPIDTPEQHALSRYLKILQFIGLPTSPVTFPFHVTPADHAAIDKLIPPNTRFAVLLPATNWPTKRWPVEHFAALIPQLQARLGLKSVLAGGPDAAALAPLLPTHFNTAGLTTLPQLIALLQRAQLVIANDSGPMHIAAALGRPLVTVFGPTNPIRTGPYNRPQSVLRLDLPCAPCYSRTCSHQSCLRWLTPDHVLNAAQLQLAASR